MNKPTQPVCRSRRRGHTPCCREHRGRWPARLRVDHAKQDHRAGEDDKAGDALHHGSLGLPGRWRADHARLPDVSRLNATRPRFRRARRKFRAIADTEPRPNDRAIGGKRRNAPPSSPVPQYPGKGSGGQRPPGLPSVTLSVGRIAVGGSAGSRPPSCLQSRAAGGAVPRPATGVRRRWRLPLRSGGSPRPGRDS